MSALTTDVVVEAPVRSRRDVRRFQRYAAAVVLLMPATLAGIGRLFQTNDDDTRAALDRIAQQPGRQFTFALLGFIGYVFVVPAFLAAGRSCSSIRSVSSWIWSGDRGPATASAGR